METRIDPVFFAGREIGEFRSQDGQTIYVSNGRPLATARSFAHAVLSLLVKREPILRGTWKGLP